MLNYNNDSLTTKISYLKNKINKRLNLNTTIITSSHQSKLIDKKIKYKIFDKLGEDFKKFVKKNFKIKNTLFISLGARYACRCRFKAQPQCVTQMFVSVLISCA